jgi:hypothetical protein
MQPITCTPRSLPSSQLLEAGIRAIEENPSNRAPVEKLSRIMPKLAMTADHIAILRSKYWGPVGVQLTVGFLDNPSQDLRRRILFHLNAWQEHANVAFVETKGPAQVRIARDNGRLHGGYWSYVGTDILLIDDDQPTMNLEGFTMHTSEHEFRRVVRHEAGHTLGFVHEHMRRELVERIDRDKAIEYFKRTQGWSVEEVVAQVLTPLEEGSLIGSMHAEPDSIMCYQLPAELMKKDHAAIVGGSDITASDAENVGKFYPRWTKATHGQRETDPGRSQNRLVFLPSAEPAYVADVLAALDAKR